MNNSIKWTAVIRDVVIIWLLTALAGFIVGISGAKGEDLWIGCAFANLIFGIVGFTICGCTTKINRWKHLFIVAVGVWLFGIINIFLVQLSFLGWLFGFIFIQFLMVIGGGLSCLLVSGSESSVVVPANEPINTNDKIDNVDIKNTVIEILFVIVVVIMLGFVIFKTNDYVNRHNNNVSGMATENESRF